jgi:hypothetical protein
MIMKAMDGKDCRIVFVTCAHTLSGEGGVFVDMAVKRNFSRHSGLVCVTINESELLL